MKLEKLNWAFGVMADLEKLLTSEGMFETSEGVQDLRISLMFEYSGMNRFKSKTDERASPFVQSNKFLN